MRRIIERLEGVGWRPAALFLAIAALAAVAMYVGLREAGVNLRTEASPTIARGQPAETPQDDEKELSDEDSQAAEPLALRLSAPTICLVGRASRDVHAILTRNDDGTTGETIVFGHWTDINTVNVAWRATGGTPPYTLAVDGESRDKNGSYRGGSGGALVSCALDNGETYFSDLWGPTQRWHRTRPTVDSGWKRIIAIATDSSGATASASIDVYAIKVVTAGSVTLRAGRTYHVFDYLITIPRGVDMMTGSIEESDCVGPNCEGSVLSIFAKDGIHWIDIGIGLKTGRAFGREHWVGNTRLADDHPWNAGGSAEHSLHAKFDELVESIGRLPHIDRD